VVHTTNNPQSARGLMAGLSVGVILAAGTTGLVVLAQSPATAQADTSTAYGVSASGVEDKGPQPSVSSAGTIKTDSGSVSGLGWTVSGITVKAGAGVAEAAVSNITVANRSIGPVTAKCADGKITYTHGGSAPNDPKLRVSFGGGAGATIQILGAGDAVVQTITVAVVKCGQGAPPTTEPTTTASTNTSARPSAQPSGTRPPAGTANPVRTPDAPAPSPQPHIGHHPVTG